MLNRAYSLVSVKAFDPASRTFSGLATSPQPDRLGDTIASDGIKYRNPMPLLLYHDNERPVGEARFSRPSDEGTPFQARIATIDRDSGVVKERLDEAVDSLAAKPPLIRGVSIGFRPLTEPTFNEKTGGFHFSRIEVLELSMVVIPAHQDATIDLVKSIDSQARAALFRTKGVPANVSMTLAEQDTSWSVPSLSDFTDEPWGDLSDTERRRIAGHYAWSTNLPPESFGELSLPHHRASDGAVVWRGVAAAAERLDQANIPAEGLAAVKAHLRRHYEQFEEEIPDILKDARHLAASGTRVKRASSITSPGVTGTSVVRLRPPRLDISMTKTVAEHIAALEAKRAANTARMEDVMQKGIDEGRPTDDAEQEEFDDLEVQTEKIDKDLVRFRALEKAKASEAKPVKKIETEKDGTQNRGGSFYLPPTQPKLEPGILLARLARVKAIAKLDGESPRTLAKEWYGEDSPVFRILVKAPVPAATTTNPTWAGALVGDTTSVFADFVEFLRPQTIVGRFGTNGIPALRRVPFRVPLIGQTSGGLGYWVGEGKAKPLTKFDFERKTLDPLKVANIAVATMEVLRDSSPSAETIIRDQLAAALRERMDLDFIDPAKAAAAGVSPASITNGVVPIVSSGSSADDVRADIRALFGAFIAANNAPTSGVWIMRATTALALSLMQNPLGQSEFPGIGMNGGTLFGLPVIVSEYVPTTPSGAYVILANAGDIYLADEGGIEVDMSQEASLQMDDAPTNASDVPTATSVVSLWQTNSVGFRAERTINWMRRRTSSVAVLSNVNWGGAPGSP